jgi:hypothetical protein
MKIAEKLYMGKVQAIGCILDFCRMPAELHHPRKNAGMGQRSSHYDVIPLCPKHHRSGGFGVAIHAGQKTFEERYGSESYLLERTKALING